MNHLRATTTTGLLAAALTQIAAPAQAIVLPRAAATQELNGHNPLPLTTGSSRVQQFYDLSEIGKSAFVARKISFRFDGPRSGPARTASIASFTLRIGATGKNAAKLDSRFGPNLTSALHTSIAGVKLNFPTDTRAVKGPESFGGPNGQLALVLPAPVLISIPTGGAFALEMSVRGGALGGGETALDFGIDPANAQRNGNSLSNGKGCPPGPNAARATLVTGGRYEPGGSLTLFGEGYPANAPVITFITAKLLANKFALPGTSPICWLYVRGDTGFALPTGNSNANGKIDEFKGGNTLPIPKAPGMCGAILYVQNATPTQRWVGNSLGVSSSNYRSIVVGCPKTPALKAWHAAHHRSAGEPIAATALYGGFAVKIE